MSGYESILVLAAGKAFRAVGDTRTFMFVYIHVVFTWCPLCFYFLFSFNRSINLLAHLE